MAWWMPVTPTAGLGRYMTVWRGWSRVSRAARNGDGLAGADLAGDHAEAAFPDAPRDAGRGLGMGGVPVQHPGGQVLAERHGREPVIALDLVYQRESLSR